jgi:predicted HTH transcriptional regulator
MSRLVMNYIQMEYGLVPTKVLKDDRAEYIQALVDAREQESLEPFREFMFRTHLRNLQQEIAAYKQSIEDDVTIPTVESQHVVKDVVKDVVKEILAILKAQPESTAASIAERVHLSSRQVQRILARLQKEDSIARHGGRKEGYWEVKI